MAKLSRLFPKLGNERESLGEVVALVRRYVLQETLVPLKRLVRAVGFSLAGALLIGVGSVFFLLGLLRVLQTETGSVFGGNWSFAPYGLTVIGSALLIGACVFVGFRHDAPEEK